MDIPKIIRFLFGLSGVMLTGFLLYGVWRIYDYIYGKPKPIRRVEPAPPPREDLYKAPNFFYDTGRREFYVSQE